MPVPGTNIDFVSEIEVLNALQRNPQLKRLTLTNTALATHFTASAIYALSADTGSVVITDATNAYKVVGPGQAVFPFGAPVSYSPSSGDCVATLSASTVFCTILYK